MNAIADDSVPRLARGCRVSTAEGQEDMLLVPEGALRLKGPGRFIVELCDGERTVRQIVEELTQRFSDADATTIETEVGAFLTRLHDRGAVDWVSDRDTIEGV
jgi:pyrroloquinoline quinone biosynthesis protein D